MNYDTALRIATNAHAGVKRKDGEDYINHPVRVSNSTFVNEDDVLTLWEIEQARIVGLLHDVVEDTTVTLHDLDLAGFSYDAVEAVELLSRVGGMTYREYVERLMTSGNKIAIAVKLGDLTDNMNSAIRTEDKKLHDLYTSRWEPTFNKLVAVWQSFPSLELLEDEG